MAITKYVDNKVQKILIVADCKDDRNLFKAVLTDMGYRVIEAVNAKQGLKKRFQNILT